MIRYTKGNLLDAKTEALVNTVNTVGVMGKGIALQFKENFKENFKQYRSKAKLGELKIGEVLAVRDRDLHGEKWILNFPTKEHWRGTSKYEYIEKGLEDLRSKIQSLEIKSIAIPPLGCGHGGLDWGRVKIMIENQLKGLEADIVIYEPNERIKDQLQAEKHQKKEVELKPGRAMLLYLLFLYEQQGEPSSVFVANKLAYFLQRSGEKLKLRFEPHHYGPYSVQVQHVLYDLNGKYLFGLEQNDARPFEALKLNYKRLEEVRSFVQTRLSHEQQQRLQSVIRLIGGFESLFSLELLATVDFLLAENKDKEEILRDVERWSKRKTKIFKPHYIDIALSRLTSHAQALF